MERLKKCKYFECLLESRGPTGLCNGHRLQVQRGKVLRPLKSQITPFQRFLSKVELPKEPWETDCWEWTGSHNRDGYPAFQMPPITDKAHRASFYFANGFLPVKPWVVDHKCRNRGCVNPAHLRSVTHADNTHNRGINRNNTSGHPGVKKQGNRWRVVVGYQRRSYHLGYFEDFEEARKVSDRFRGEKHKLWSGEF